MNLVALAGALADRDPPQARALLAESLKMRATLDIDFDAFDATQSILIAARMADWPLVLKLGPGAIHHHHWAGTRPFLAGILNVLARALAPADPESAAVFQGAARRLIPAVHAPRGQDAASSSVVSPGGPAAGAASFVTELRRQTTAILQGSLGEERLRQLRAEGQAMDDDHVVAYTLDAIGRAARDGT